MTLVTYHSDPARPVATLLVPSPEQLPESGDHWCGQPPAPGGVAGGQPGGAAARPEQVNPRLL